MKIRELMTKDVVTLKPEHTVWEAAKLMHDLEVGIIPICVQNNHLQGVITDRDIVVRAVAKGMDIRKTKIGDIMSAKVVTIEERSNVREAVELMAEHQIRRLPVMSDDNKMIGIVAIGDISVEHQLEDEAAHALHDVSYPARPMRGDAAVQHIGQESTQELASRSAQEAVQESTIQE